MIRLEESNMIPNSLLFLHIHMIIFACQTKPSGTFFLCKIPCSMCVIKEKIVEILLTAPTLFVSSKTNLVFWVTSDFSKWLCVLAVDVSSYLHPAEIRGYVMAGSHNIVSLFCCGPSLHVKCSILWHSAKHPCWDINSNPN